MRVKANWNSKKRKASPDDIGGVIAVNIWRIAGDVLLNLENQDFEISSYEQRMLMMEEMGIFLAHMADRMMFGRIEPELRGPVVTALAKRLGALVQNNREELTGSGDYIKPFIDKLNERFADYSEYAAEANTAGFAMRRYLGSQVQKIVGEKDRRWVSDQIIDIEAPDAMPPLIRTIDRILAQG